MATIRWEWQAENQATVSWQGKTLCYQPFYMSEHEYWGGLLSRLFASGRKHPKGCKATRMAVEKHVVKVIGKW